MLNPYDVIYNMCKNYKWAKIPKQFNVKLNFYKRLRTSNRINLRAMCNRKFDMIISAKLQTQKGACRSFCSQKIIPTLFSSQFLHNSKTTMNASRKQKMKTNFPKNSSVHNAGKSKTFYRTARVLSI